MKTFKIYGASDDLIETEGLQGCDEFNVYPNGPYAGRVTIKAGDVSLAVHAIYDGHWAFAIGPDNGDYDEMPEWKITRAWGRDSAYSETVEIECPDEARLVHDFGYGDDYD